MGWLEYSEKNAAKQEIGYAAIKHQGLSNNTVLTRAADGNAIDMNALPFKLSSSSKSEIRGDRIVTEGNYFQAQPQLNGMAVAATSGKIGAAQFGMSRMY